jgi:uncharacterized oxidoreductase
LPGQQKDTRGWITGTPIAIIEIIPPAVDIDLGGKGLHTFGLPVNEFTDAIVKQLKMGSIEATYGFSVETSQAMSELLEAIFKRMNQPR